jgi:hypothetical protein
MELKHFLICIEADRPKLKWKRPIDQQRNHRSCPTDEFVVKVIYLAVYLAKKGLK